MPVDSCCRPAPPQPALRLQVQAAINAVEELDVLNQEVDYIAEGERLLRQNRAARPQAPPQATAAAAPRLQQPPPAASQPTSAAAPTPAAPQAAAPMVRPMSYNGGTCGHTHLGPTGVFVTRHRIYKTVQRSSNLRRCCTDNRYAAICRPQQGGQISANPRRRLRRGRSWIRHPLARAASASARTWGGRHRVHCQTR